ncbi:hypothetical protein SAMN05421837_101426 [Amycolatopsis pretoriensis]|uniref:DUF6292 domain-containing protein n=1 Tax=Amycolatopsis pretoriensis TaxID=218821 RepID=A0A1H5Q3T9_9PSEU|nr:DUF6292 family protein [Amycolatopsis pretoriensis]SEF20589.1 hypothetical protein SAMN05421837_101426 [Amycolatopsis pretoriensis]
MLQRGLRSWEIGLAGYLRVVSEAVGVLPGGLGRDFDPPAAYLALSRRSPRDPERDLLLVWSADAGWELVLEHPELGPGETLARFGDPLVPEPADVAGFVDDVLAGRRRGGRPASGSACDLHELLSGFAVLVLPPGGIQQADPDRAD